MSSMLPLQNGRAVPLAELPVVGMAEFRDSVLAATASGARIVSLFGQPQGSGVRLYAVLTGREGATLSALSADAGASYPALTPDCTQAHLFEREIAEQWGVRPEGHPWLKPIRFHRSYRPGCDAWGRKPDEEILPGVTEFFRVEGEEVHEVAVGPVHAGVIEPGHFRFQCHGEDVFHLEISLGYQHRGVERALVGGPDRRTPHFMETLAGDTTIGHATAYAQAVESLARATPPARAEVLRGIALELERIANHTGDLGALAGDIGYLPTASYCGRLRGDVLNLTALACGNRFGRSWLAPGGAAFDLEPARAAELRERLQKALADIRNAADLLWNTPSVLARFEDAGPVTKEAAVELGLVGPAARACGLNRDVRFELPAGLWRFTHIPISCWHDGDVFARAYVRWLEIQRSADFILAQLEALPEGPIRSPVGPPAPDRFVVSMAEGWRGEICHVAITDERGRFAHYKVTDPSFHNWMGLALALRGQQISDFPLCNKSFNLSYCGHDL
ncbi:MAG: hydrogenase [Candidatus Brocadiia bacterium]